MPGCPKGRIPLLYTSAQASVSLLVIVCVCVCVCVRTHLGASESITTNPGVETCNSDRFTRMHPQIYGCVSICMGVSVFSGETPCVTQDKRVFVRAGVHKTRERFSEPQFGKNGKGAYYDPGPEF